MRRNRSPRPEIGAELLSQVVTVREACQMWNYSRSSVLYAINRGYVTARRIGRDWIIVADSLRAHWGAPTGLNNR